MSDDGVLDVAMVLADVAGNHNANGRGECEACMGAPWMCGPARLAMVVASLMEMCDNAEDAAPQGQVALIRACQLRDLIIGAVNFVPLEQRG